MGNEVAAFSELEERLLVLADGDTAVAREAITIACADGITPAASSSDTAATVYPLVTAMENAFEDNEIKDYLRCQPKQSQGAVSR